MNAIRAQLERQLCQGALEFAAQKWQDARLSGSIDAQLDAGEHLFQTATATLTHLYSVQAVIV